MKTYKYNREDLISLGVIWWDNKKYGNIYYVERICKIKNLDFEKCFNIRIEEYDLYTPKLCFDYK